MYVDAREDKRKVLINKYPLDCKTDIEKRLADCENWIIAVPLKNRVESVFPSCMIDEAMDLWKYCHNNDNISPVTYKKKYRKLQEAMFKRTGTYKNRLRIDIIKLHNSLPATSGFYKILESDEYKAVHKYMKSSDAVEELSDAEYNTYLEGLNLRTDELIERQILPRLYEEIKPFEFWKVDNDGNTKLVKRHAPFTWQEIENIMNHDRDYHHTNINRRIEHDYKEDNLNKLNRRPSVVGDLGDKQ